MSRTTPFVLFFLTLLSDEVTASQPVTAISPNGRVRIEILLRKGGDEDALPHYLVTFDRQEIIGPSRLGVEILRESALGGPCEIVSVQERSVRDEFTQVTGKRRLVRHDANEVTVAFREATGTKRGWVVQLRAADDGVAFRYEFPKQAGFDSIAVKQERTEFRLPSDAKAFALPLNGFTTSYEKRYAAKLAKDWLLGLPLLLECPGGIWAAITEANVNEYAGLYLSPLDVGLLLARLSPLPKEPSVSVRHTLPHRSPWRVVMLGDDVGRPVESDLVLALSEPCAIKDTSWIRTGKTTFPWWNGFYEENLNFKPGLNTATAKYYIDFCAEAGIPYHSLDGVGNTAWYGGPIVPYKGAEPTKGLDGLDLPEVLKYAASKGVRIRLWMHWGAAEAYMSKALPLYHQWGIEGVMLDFMDRDDQEMNRFVRKAAALAAENKLTVTLHGCPKPTGLERTYPNLLTHEGVMNLEYQKMGQGRDNSGTRSDSPLYQDACWASRLSPGVIPYRPTGRLQSPQRSSAGHWNTRSHAGQLCGLPESPLHGCRLPVVLPETSRFAGPRRDTHHLGRHEGPGSEGWRVCHHRSQKRERVAYRGDDRRLGQETDIVARISRPRSVLGLAVAR